VKDDGDALSLSVAKRIGQARGGKREERDVHQQHGVQEQHQPVGMTDVIEHDVMVRTAPARSARTCPSAR
jgi:hypothetical protein